MAENKSSNKKAITFVLIIVILILSTVAVCLILQNKKLRNSNTDSEQKITQLQATLEQLEQTVTEVKNITANVPTSSNSQATFVEKEADSSITVGYEIMIAVLDSKPYVVPIHRPDVQNLEENIEPRGTYYYNQFEIDNIQSGVKKAYAFTLGSDPSSTIYFVMEDGSVRSLEESGNVKNPKFTSKEVLKSSNNIVELKMDDSTLTLNAVTKDGKKIKVAEEI